MELEKETLLKLYPPYDSVLGPYDRKDGRKHIVLNNSKASKGTKGKTKTISFPKAVVESNLGRKLEANEEIDHRDDNKLNNDPDNFQILTKTKNRIKQQIAIYGEPIHHYCVCGKLASTTYSKTERGGKVIKYCSDECRKRKV